MYNAYNTYHPHQTTTSPPLPSAPIVTYYHIATTPTVFYNILHIKV